MTRESHHNWIDTASWKTLTSRVSFDAGWLILVRACFLTLMLISIVVHNATHLDNTGSVMQLLYLPILLLYVFCIASGVYLKRVKTPGSTFIYTQLIVDIAVITGLIWISGGPISPFLFLYLPLIMAAAILMSQRVALAIALATAAAYSLLIWGLLQGVIPSADPNAGVITPQGGVLFQLLGLLSALVLVAVATSYLKKKLASSYEMVLQSRRDFFEISNRQKLIIDGLPAGVIVTDISGKISTVNPSATTLLNAEQLAVGSDISELLSSLGIKLDADLLLENSDGFQQEMVINKGGEEVKISFHARAVLDPQGAPNGLIFVFEDVTQLRSAEEQLQLHERMAELLAKKDNCESITTAPINGFVGESPVMKKVFRLIERVAPSEATVLIHGESGTGKELVGKAIHLSGPRKNGPFVAVNCGAIPENLIESELFGHKKGSFTGADSDHTGLFRKAEGGTLFLDEIGELPLHMQAKLLRALQEKKVRPVGADRDIPINIRVVAATNRNLKDEVEKGNFREDLYYRLNVIGINLPSLKERKEDIPLLVDTILRRLVDSDTVPVVSPAAMQLLLNYDYPGNVRELENMLERAVVLGGEVILPEHLPENVRNFETSDKGSRRNNETLIVVDENLEFPVSLDELLEDVEKRYLEVALLKTNGAKKKAAELLGINFRSFRYRLQKFGIGEDE
ncbi:MAG: PAS domain-containing protein [Candidatus Dadabacteria bacterium]|nr:MAG: PAS domain-containing protein [Candidatus Dadabacteria bacterium]